MSEATREVGTVLRYFTDRPPNNSVLFNPTQATSIFSSAKRQSRLLALVRSKQAIASVTKRGNLAAAVALMARDRGGPKIAYQLLIYPATDAGLDTPSQQQFQDDGYILSKKDMIWFWGHYLNGDKDKTNPYACPAEANNLRGLPPALVVTAGFDPLRDEGETYAARLQDAGVKDIKNLQVLTPGVTVTSTTSENVTTARVRGVGTVGDNPGLESSVGVIIDGVYRARNGVGFGDLGEIEQIEVLEGPQGELFGKNNDAGVISVVTKRPSTTFGVTAEVTGGNHNDREISASITGR